MEDVFYGFVDTIKPYTAEKLSSVICYGDGKGNFDIVDLPPDLQLAPIFSFQELNTPGNQDQYLCGGNFFDVIPYEGRYDAQPLTVFNREAKYVHQSNLINLNAQVRDIKWLRTASDRNIVVVATNNDRLRFYGFKK